VKKVEYLSPLSAFLSVANVTNNGTHKNERTVLYKTKSLDGTKPNTNPNPNHKLTVILTIFSCFMLFRAPSLDLQSSLNN